MLLSILAMPAAACAWCDGQKRTETREVAGHVAAGGFNGGIGVLLAGGAVILLGGAGAVVLAARRTTGGTIVFNDQRPV